MFEYLEGSKRAKVKRVRGKKNADDNEIIIKKEAKKVNLALDEGSDDEKQEQEEELPEEEYIV